MRKIEGGEGVVIKPEGLLEEKKEGCKQKELEVLSYDPLLSQRNNF